MPSLAQRAEAIAGLYQPPITGRHSDIASQSTVQQFLEAVGEGNYIETAAKLAGITKQSVYEWMKRGETGEQPFALFADAVKEAEARAEAHMVRLQRKAAELPQYWAAAATHLERRHPERWGKRQDDQSGPKVVVQVGGSSADVKVMVVGAHNPSTFALDGSTVSEDIHRLSGDIESNNNELCLPNTEANTAIGEDTRQGASEQLEATEKPARGLTDGTPIGGIDAPQNFSPRKRRSKK
jgi:hypothetical protein